MTETNVTPSGLRVEPSAAPSHDLRASPANVTDDPLAPGTFGRWIAGMPQRFHADMGLRATRLDHLERRLHALFWRCVPRPISGTFAPVYFGLRRRYGTPGWRTFYSRERLAADRAAADAGRTEKP